MTLIPLLPGEPDWTPQDAAALRVVIHTPHFQRLLMRLLFARPEVSGYDREQRAVQSDERAGYESCISQILLLADPNHAPVTQTRS